MILRIAWKNVWRSKRRSAIVVVAIALGLWGGLFAAGVMEGLRYYMGRGGLKF